MVSNSPGRRERRYPRMPLKTEVHYESPNLTIVEETRNVSKGGIFIASSLLDEVGTRAKLHIYVPGSQRPVEVEGVVKWTTLERSAGMECPYPESGMGIEFVRAVGELDGQPEAIDDGAGHRSAGST